MSISNDNVKSQIRIFYVLKICIFLILCLFKEEMMFCDNCDRGYHSYCVGLKEIPKGNYFFTDVKHFYFSSIVRQTSYIEKDIERLIFAMVLILTFYLVNFGMCCSAILPDLKQALSYL